MFCFRHPKRIAVKVCYHCGRLVCPKCQWRDSHHTFCGQACYKRYIFWQKVKEIRRMVIREVRAFSLLLSKKAAAIPIGNGYVPAILPILALTSIHTYTTLTTKDYKPSIRYEIQEFKDSSPEIRSLDTTIKNLKTTDTAQIVVAYNAQPEENNLKQQTLDGVKKEFITRQLKETARIFKELTGRDMIPCWRAPYGEQNAEIRQWAYEAGFTHIGWTTGYKKRESLDTLDWVSNEESEFYYSADEIKERVLNFDKEGNGVSGGIVLMHLGTERKESHAYTKLPEIIDTLTDRGYRIVKV